MTRSHVLRLLRIAVSAVCGILCLLLIGLWVGSYWWQGYAAFPLPNKRVLCFTFGEQQVQVSANPMVDSGYPTLVTFNLATNHPPPLQSGWATWPNPRVTMPNWLLVILTATAALAPWFKWQFSLRTLLIATTLVAVVLGLVVAIR